MIKINNAYFTIKRTLVDKEDCGMRHLCLEVTGDVESFDNERCDIILIDDNDNEDCFIGDILMPHYCAKNETTMFLIFVEDIMEDNKC